MNFAKALRAGFDPGNWPAMRHGVVPTIEHRVALARLAPATVLDVGANKGQFAWLAHRMWPRAALHVFEPLAGPRATLAKVVGRVATIHPFALGAEDAEREIHVGSRADSSSLLPIGLNQTRIFGTTEAGSVTIKVRRLDGVFGRSEISAPALLKIDVQGFEYQVLEGIGALHEDIAWIFVEVSYIELYEGQRLAGEVDALLGRLGYRLGATHNLQRGVDGQPIQADLLYVRDA